MEFRTSVQKLCQRLSGILISNCNKLVRRRISHQFRVQFIFFFSKSKQFPEFFVKCTMVILVSMSLELTHPSLGHLRLYYFPWAWILKNCWMRLLIIFNSTWKLNLNWSLLKVSFQRLKKKQPGSRFPFWTVFNFVFFPLIPCVFLFPWWVKL